MKIKLLDFAKLHKELEDRLIDASTNIIKSGQYILGNPVSDFEKKISNYLDTKYVLGVGNGTDALELALQALQVGEGDEVITSSFTYFASAECIASAGAKVVFADVCPKTFNITADTIAEKITPNTKAIITVDIFGNPVNYIEIEKLVTKHNLKWINDSCQALSAEYNNMKLGSFGDFTCFSMFPTKNLGALGDAGLLTTSNEDLYIIAKGYARHGSGLDGAKAYTLISGEEVSTGSDTNELINPAKYYNYLIGRNSRLDSMQAALLSVKLDYLDIWTKTRISNAEYIKSNYKGDRIRFQEVTTCSKHIYHQLTCYAENRVEIINELNNNGIQTAIYYPIPLHLQIAFNNLNHKLGDFPVSEYLCNHVFTIPCAPELSKNDLDSILNVLNKF